MKNVQIFKYNENPVSFQMGEQKMINATQMAKGFGKRVQHFLNTSQTQEFIEVLSRSRNLGFDQLVIIKKGGKEQGTWMHEDLAIVFAQWLSPEFYIWCNDRIKELFRFGLTATDEMLVKAATDPEFVVAMMEQIKENRQKTIALEEHNRQLQAQIEENASKVQFYDNVTKLDEDARKRKTFIISKIAKELKMSTVALNKHLIRERIIVRTENGYAVHPDYTDSDIAYPRILNKPLYDSEGEIICETQQYLTYTHKGREMIIQSLENKKIKR